MDYVYFDLVLPGNDIFEHPVIDIVINGERLAKAIERLVNWESCGCRWCRQGMLAGLRLEKRDVLNPAKTEGWREIMLETGGDGKYDVGWDIIDDGATVRYVDIIQQCMGVEPVCDNFTFDRPQYYKELDNLERKAQAWAIISTELAKYLPTEDPNTK